MSQSAWTPRLRDYEQEAKEGVLPFKSTSDHPLQSTAQVEKEPEKEVKPSKKVFDPLSGSSFFDPLSSDFQPVMSSGGRSDTPDDFPTWESRKADILTKYTTNKTIGVPSFLQGVKPKVAVPVDRVKDRLEQLDQDDEEDEILQLTQKDYQKHIEKKRESLIQAWDTDKRVRALKIAIKCAKLLGSTSEVVQFYPSKFVMITEILDTFGTLVYDRIKSRSTIDDEGTPIPLKENFRCEDVADHAKETCKNWFFKIASIRELIPRLFVEMCIVTSYRFIENDTFPQHFARLIRMCRGIADPLVAMYARAYLVRKGREVFRFKTDYILQGFEDSLLHQALFSQSSLAAFIAARGVNEKEYLDLFTPAMEYMLECLAYKEDPNLLKHILSKYNDSKNGFLLSAILQSFQPRLIAKQALEFVKLIKDTGPEVDKVSLYRTLGVNLGLAEPPKEHKLKLLNAVWKDVTTEKDVKKYMEVAEVWIGYPLAHLSWKETNILLKDILAHVGVDKIFFDYQTLLQSIMDKILRHKESDFNQVFGMSNFLPFLDLFRGETQMQVNKALLENFTRTKGKVSDPLTINTLFTVAKTVHDSITALSFEDEKREISVLLCAFLNKLEFGKDLDKHLNFFVEARRAFVNLDLVKVELVKSVCALAVQTQKREVAKASAFLRACLAYCFITIPSIDSEYERLHLYLLAGQVSLLCQSLPQADEMFKSAIMLVKESPTKVEEREGKWRNTYTDMYLFLRQFIGVLVAVPGHPGHGAFYLLEQLQKIIQSWDWESKSTHRVSLNASVIALLAANYQKKLPYKWDKVESNDVLYGNTQKHLKDIQSRIDGVLSDIFAELDRLKEYQDIPSRTSQADAITELIQTIIDTAELSPDCIELINQLVLREKALKSESRALSKLITTLKESTPKEKEKLRLQKEQLVAKIEETIKLIKS